MVNIENSGRGHGEERTAEPGQRLGVIITNRDRSGPLGACLASLAIQEIPPTWVVISDLSSQPPHREALTALADSYGTSYLRIEHEGAWNKSLAFNTAFRLALSDLPRVTHVIQLDADMILHPSLLGKAAAELAGSGSFWCAPRMAPPDLVAWIPGDNAGYERMLAQCGPVQHLAVGVFLALPCDWLASQRGFDEAFVGWGHEDTELLLRASKSLAVSRDMSGRLLIHQWHEPQENAGKQGRNWPLLVYRMANPASAVNPAGWGNGQVIESVLRSGLIGAPLTGESSAGSARTS